MIIKTQTLFDYNAYACFIDKKLMQQHKLALVKKMTLIGIEIINVRNISLGPMTHETKVLDITIRSHFSKVVFDVISSSKNPIIIGLFDSFCIIHEWISIWGVSILKHPNKNLWIVEPLSQTWLVKHMNLYIYAQRRIKWG
jgi:hypothetical protein